MTGVQTCALPIYYKVRHESKIGDINQSIEEVNFEDIFTPVEESIGIEEKPEIISSKSK